MDNKKDLNNKISWKMKKVIAKNKNKEYLNDINYGSNNEKLEVKLLDDIDIDDLNKLIKDYIDSYKNIFEKYKKCVVKGKGKKTNGYHKPEMNFAYNYIEHADYFKSAREPIKGYTKNGKHRSKDKVYYYFVPLWSAACEQLSQKYAKLLNNKVYIKLDHRQKQNKDHDFDGYLCVYTKINSWKKYNLPENQRYSIEDKYTKYLNYKKWYEKMHKYDEYF